MAWNVWLPPIIASALTGGATGLVAWLSWRGAARAQARQRRWLTYVDFLRSIRRVRYAFGYGNTRLNFEIASGGAIVPDSTAALQALSVVWPGPVHEAAREYYDELMLPNVNLASEKLDRLESNLIDVAARQIDR